MASILVDIMCHCDQMIAVGQFPLLVSLAMLVHIEFAFLDYVQHLGVPENKTDFELI